MGSSSPIFGVKIKNVWVATTNSKHQQLTIDKLTEWNLMKSVAPREKNAKTNMEPKNTPF